jgi:hypothetical protein
MLSLQRTAGQHLNLARPQAVQRKRSSSLPYKFNYAYTPQYVYLDDISAEPASFSIRPPSVDYGASPTGREHFSTQRDPFRVRIYEALPACADRGSFFYSRPPSADVAKV